MEQIWIHSIQAVGVSVDHSYPIPLVPITPIREILGTDFISWADSEVGAAIVALPSVTPLECHDNALAKTPKNRQVAQLDQTNTPAYQR
jgi:hypothetical protein